MNYRKEPKLQSGQAQLIRHVNRAFPGYGNICGVGFPMKDLLPHGFYNADVTFLIAAWLYSSVVSNDVFPCGLRQWQPQISNYATSLSSALALVPIAPSFVSTAASSTDPSGSSSKKAAIASPP